MTKKDLTKKVTIPMFLTFLLTFFLLGVFSSDYIKEVYVKNFIKTSDSEYILGTEDKKYNSNLDKPINLDKYWNVYNLIEKNYYSIDGLKKEDLINGSIKGLVNSIGDKHSEYLTIDEAKKFSEMLSGDFEGIGAVVEKVDLGVSISRVIKGSPAKKYGVKADDIILEANGVELKDLGLYDSVDKIKGPDGTKVLLKILRQGNKGFLEIEVTRDKIKIPSVDFELLKDNIGYISLNMFGENTSMEFEKALLELKDTSGLIIDLRDNGGGYLHTAVEIISNFIENGKVIVTTKSRDSNDNIVYKSINDKVVYDKKIVVIINENSASASEITAGALRDHNKSILVGKKSYGKGSVQNPFTLDDGSLLKITIAKWFTPNDINIDKEGIKPDIEIDFLEEDYDAEACVKSKKCNTEEDFEPYDRQLEEAKKVLKNYIKIGSIGLTIDEYNKNNLSDNK